MSPRAPQRYAEDSLQIGRYEIVRKLAVGGMAELYLARSRGLEGFEKLVVLKRMLPEFTRRPHYVRMFLDEARLAARLQHPGLVQAYDIGESDGEYFFSMEFVHGHDLRAVMRAADDGVPLDVALTIAITIASGLHYAHELADERGKPLGVVHRDVSPSNILVSFDGHAKLLDFGVAKAVSSTDKTKSGTVKGKPGYMSPEQCQGEELDRRSDIFALGIVLYEMTVGARLFRRDNEFATMTAIVLDDIERPTSRRAGYPPELERIVMRALDKDREHRYRTAQQMQVELEELVRREQLSTSSVRLAAFMESLFAAELARVRGARERGQSLAGLLAEGDTDTIEQDTDSPSYGAAVTSASQRLGRQHAETVTAQSGSAPREVDAVSSAASTRPRSRRRMWLLPLLVAVAGAGYAATTQLGGSRADSVAGADASPAVAGPASTTAAPANDASPQIAPPAVTPATPDAGEVAQPIVEPGPPVRRTRPTRTRKPPREPAPGSEAPSPAPPPEREVWDPDSPVLR